MEESHYTILSLDSPTRLMGSSVNRHQQFWRNYHLVDWGRFQRCVDNNVDYEAQPATPEAIARQLRSIEEAISVAREQHVPTTRQLEREFDRFGAIKKIEYNKGDTQAYILYDSIDAATAAVKEMRGFPLGAPDRRIRIDFANNGTTPSFSKCSGGFEEGGEYRRGPDYEYPEGGASHEENSSYGYGGRPFRGRGGFRGHGGFRGGFHRDGPPHHGDNDERRRSGADGKYDSRRRSGSPFTEATQSG
ncbi:RNA-binding protein spenito-like [Armigeres subalbatus]|uniref:RNA-binding protein spenito-like n=1 Tax=Armigeres subalbatus TaxID=124917 RepID=UPI002ED2FFD2